MAFYFLPVWIVIPPSGCNIQLTSSNLISRIINQQQTFAITLDVTAFSKMETMEMLKVTLFGAMTLLISWHKLLVFGRVKQWVNCTLHQVPFINTSCNVVENWYQVASCNLAVYAMRCNPIMQYGNFIIVSRIFLSYFFLQI